MTSKECIKCNKELPIDMFEITKRCDKIYYRNKCKLCRLHEIHEQRKKRKEQIKLQLTHKTCTECSKNLDISKFNNKSLSKDGYDNICRECYKIVRCKYKQKQKIQTDNKTIYCVKCKLIKVNTEFRTNARSLTGYFKTCNNCWKPVEWNKDKQHIAEKKYVTNNPEKIREKNKRMSKLPQRIIRSRLQGRIRGALKSNNLRKNNKTIQYIGCDISYLKKWLEFQFTDGINWNNMRMWHIDHVTPCISFDLTNEKEQYICFNWQNLRPCLAAENLEKNDKIIHSIIKKQEELVSKFLKINPLPTQPGDRVEGAE